MSTTYLGYMGADWCHKCKAPADTLTTQTLMMSDMSGTCKQYSYCVECARTHSKIQAARKAMGWSVSDY